MNLVRPALAAAALATALIMVHAPAEAHSRWRGGVTLHFGVPWPGYWYPRYYYAPPPAVYYPAPGYPGYAYPPTVIEPSPPTYVERDDPAPAAESSAPPAIWYWCADAKKYYPYVKDCPGGWRKVPAQPSQ
jgi:hypothetical protein